MSSLRLWSLFVCACLTLCASADDQARILVGQANVKLDNGDRKGAEKSLRKAVELWRQSQSASSDEFAATLVLLGLVALGNRTSPAGVRPIAEEALSLYEDGRTVDDSRLGLSIELLAATHQIAGDSAVADTLWKRSTAIRAQIIERMQIRNGGYNPQRATVAPATVERATEEMKKPPSAKSEDDKVTAPSPIYKPEPDYSREARVIRRQGAVLLSVVIYPDGKIRNVRLRRSIGFGLDEKAYEAVTKWIIKPATRRERPVAVSANIEVNFKLL